MLEGAHLERVLGVALIALVIVVVGLLAYFIWEPFRETAAATGFKERSVERGATLFANDQSPAYDSTKSLLCADCHGADGGGGTANFRCRAATPAATRTQKVDRPHDAGRTACPSRWRGPRPTSQLAPLRYSRAQLTQIITYGRPGTPMPAWGVASGKGALQTAEHPGPRELRREHLAPPPTRPRPRRTKEVASCNDRAACVGASSSQDPEDAGRGRQVGHRRPGRARRTPRRALADRGRRQDSRHLHQAGAAEAGARCRPRSAWQQTTQSATDGAILFMNNCARCHTRGLVVLRPDEPRGQPAAGIMGGGAYGPNLTGGDVNNQFPPPNGEAELLRLDQRRRARQRGQYGIRGISSGRMPHFGAVLTKTQIEAIMAYERSL